MDCAITQRTYARVGLFGNPSDQYGGRTIAFSLENFYAEVTLTPTSSPSAIHILPHPVYDSTAYASLDELVQRTSTEGLYGGVRLLTAACKRFAQHCHERGIPLVRRWGTRQHPTDKTQAEAAGEAANGDDSGADMAGEGTCGGFTLSYDTNVPRQTGMAGSSAIIYSTIKCLMIWYGLDEQILPYCQLPGLILSVEAGELGIAAGLQDRVIQVYGGVVHMNFHPSYMEANGGIGRYSRLPTALLPAPLYIMYSQNPSESGKVHSGVKARWLAGDPEVRALMTRVAACADTALKLLMPQGPQHQQPQPTNDHSAVPDPIGPNANPAPSREQQLADLMTANVELRRALFGEEILGTRNLRMVELARSVGAGVNFTGSGGAVVVLCPGGRDQADALRVAAEREGFCLVEARVGPEMAPLPVLGEL